MNEQQWLTSNDPAAMLRHVGSRIGDRKRLCLADAVQRFSVEALAEQGKALAAQGFGPNLHLPFRAALLREIFGNPFRSFSIERDMIRQDCGGNGYKFLGGILTWRNGLLRSIAQQIRESGQFQNLPILGDAWEECSEDLCQARGFSGGIAFPEILAHCRQTKEHVRGCWVVDLLAGEQIDG